MPDLYSSNSKRFGLLCLAVTSIGWGLNWPAMKILLRELPPLFARGSAGMSAALGFAIAALVLRQRLRIPRSAIAPLMLASFINVFAWMGFSTLALRWLSVGQGALLVFTMPIWATLLAWPLLGKRPSVFSVLGLLMSVAGLWTLFGGTALRLDTDQLMGASFALAAALLFAFGTVSLKPIPKVQPVAMVAWQLILGCLPMVVIGAQFENPDLTRVTGSGWALMLYMTLVPMGLCYLTWFAALRRLPPATASIATLLTPVIGVIGAAYTIGEPLGVKELVALLLTLGGIGLALLPNNSS